MRILREDYIIHPFREMPKEEDINNGYVRVVISTHPIVTRNVLYTVEHGWNTVSKSDALGISAVEMAGTYVGWISEGTPKIIPNHESWFTRINEIIEELELERRDDLWRHDGEYWNNVDELVGTLKVAIDFAEGLK